MDATLSKRERRPVRSGFTLVELLVVIAIIGLLAGMAMVGGAAAMRAAKRSAVVTEISQLKMALAKYKSECGDYPPDCYCIDYTGSDPALLAIQTKSQNEILRHLRKRFPRYQTGWDKLRLDVYNASSGLNLDLAQIGNIDPEKGFDINNLNPSNALVFFLGGIPDYEPDTSAGLAPGTDGGELMGFSANPSNPIARGGSRLPANFEFAQTQIFWFTTDKTYKYCPDRRYIKNPDDSSKGVPYAYFRARSGGYDSSAKIDVPSSGTAFPYARKTTPTTDWYEPQGFQIIAAGLDGEFSPVAPATPLATPRYLNADDNNLTPEEDDNLSSFTTGRLEDGAE